MKKIDPYKEGYCLVRYVPPAIAKKVYSACRKAKPNSGVKLIPAHRGSYPSIWAISPYGLTKVVDSFRMKMRKEERKELRKCSTANKS